MPQRETPNATARGFRQEDERIDRGWVVIGGAIVLPFLLVLAVAAKTFFVHVTRDDGAQGVPTRPEPAAEVSNVHAELFERRLAGERLQDRQRKTLGRYAWVDRQHGIVRVPIDVAIELVAEDAKEQP